MRNRNNLVFREVRSKLAPFLLPFCSRGEPSWERSGRTVTKGSPTGFTTLERPLANDVTRPPTRPVYFRSSPINYSAGFCSDLITVLTILVPFSLSTVYSLRSWPIFFPLFFSLVSFLFFSQLSLSLLVAARCCPDLERRRCGWIS